MESVEKTADRNASVMIKRNQLAMQPQGFVRKISNGASIAQMQPELRSFSQTSDEAPGQLRDTRSQIFMGSYSIQPVKDRANSLSQHRRVQQNPKEKPYGQQALERRN